MSTVCVTAGSILPFSVMHRERPAHPGEPLAKTDGLLDRDTVPPCEQVPAHFVDSTRGEAHRDRAVIVLLNGLIRMEEERRSIPRRLGVESQDHPDGLLLKRAERAFGVALQVERRIPLERLVGEPRLADICESPEPGLVGPVGPCCQERAVAVEQAVGLNTLMALPYAVLPIGDPLGERRSLPVAMVKARGGICKVRGEQGCTSDF